jgi:type IV pilus assembly protein PilV
VSGFTLIEMLIALLIVTIGLLGMAGLQAYSLKNNVSAYHRSQANNRVYEILDLMRANRPAALAGAYDIEFGDPAPDGASRAEIDVAHWRNALRAGEADALSNPAGLPLGDGAIRCATTPPVCTIIVEWDDTRGSAAGSRQQIAISTQI